MCTYWSFGLSLVLILSFNVYYLNYLFALALRIDVNRLLDSGLTHYILEKVLCLLFLVHFSNTKKNIDKYLHS